MSPRTRSAQRERAMLDAALAVFLEKGFDGATMLEIATRAQVGKGTLYGLAPSKEELYLRVTFDFFEQMMVAVTVEIEREAPAAEKLRRIVHGFLEDMDTQMPVMWLSLELLARAHRDERLRRRIATAYGDLYRRFIESTTGLIETAQRSGEIAPRHPEALARILAAVLDGIGFQMMFDTGEIPRREIVETLLEMLRAREQRTGDQPETPGEEKRAT